MFRHFPLWLVAVSSGCQPSSDTGSGTSLCSSWFPVDRVRSEVWTTTSENTVAEGGVERSWLGEVVGSPGIYRAEATTNYRFSSTGTVQESESWTEYSCDDTGVYIQGSGGRFRSDGGPWQAWEEVPVAPMLAVPSDLGDGWEAPWETERIDDNGTSQRSWVTTHEVLGPDSVTTPAGTFDTVQIRSRIDSASDWGRYHLGEDVGWVLFEESIQLAEHTSD